MPLETVEDRKKRIRLEISFQSLEWQQVRDYLHARRNRLFDQLASEKDMNEIARLQGRILEIEQTLGEESLPAPLAHSKQSAY